MVQGTYKVSADTPMGRKSGTLVLSGSDAALHAKLKVALLGTFEADGSAQGSAFSFSGTVKIPLVGSGSYQLDGIVEGDRLEAVCRAKGADIVVTGTRV